MRIALCQLKPTASQVYKKFHLRKLATDNRVAVWRSGSALVLINEVNLRRVRLVPRWVTVSGFTNVHVCLLYLLYF